MPNAQVLVLTTDKSLVAQLTSILPAPAYLVLPPVATGDNAVAQLAAQQPDLIIIDIRRDDAALGIATAAQIRTQFAVPLLYLIAEDATNSLRQAQATQPDGYVIMPLDAHQVRATIEAALARHKVAHLYRTLIDILPDGVSLSDLTGTITFASRRLTEMYGVRDTQVAIGTHALDWIAPESRAQAATNIASLGHGATSPDDQYVLLRHDGTRFIGEIKGALLTDAHGNPKGIVTVHRDVTERKKAEDALRESEERYRQLFQQAPVGVFHYNPQFAITECNDRFVEILQSSRERLIGLDMRQLKDRSVLPALENALTGKPGYFEGEYHATTSSAHIWIAMRTTPLFDAHGAIVGGMGIIENISARVAVEQALRANRALLNAAIESLPFEFWAIGADGRYVLQNRASLAHWGNVIGMQPQELGLPESILQTWQASNQRAFAGELVHRKVEYLQDNAPHAFQNITAPIRDGDAIQGILGINIDITDHERTEEALRKSEAQYRLLFENNPLPMWVYDQATLAFLAVNDAAIKHYGYTRDEFLAMTIKDIRPPEDVPRLIQINAAPEAGMRKAGMWRHRKKDETLIDVEITSHDIDFRGNRARLVLANDITERRRAEAAEHEQRTLAEALRDTAATLTSTLDFAQVLERILDNVGRVVPHDAADLMLIEGESARVVGLRGFDERGLAYIANLRVPFAEWQTFRHMLTVAEPILIANTDNDPRWTYLPEIAWVHSYIGAPIRSQGKVIGFLNLDSATPNFFNATHAARLQIFADQAAVALENARLLAESQQRAEQLTLLYDAALTLNRAIAPHVVIEHLLQIASRVVHAERADFFRFNPDEQTLTYQAGSGYASEFFDALRTLKFIVGETCGLVGAVAVERIPLYVPDVRQEPNWIVVDPAVRSALWVPVEREGQLYGVLTVTSSRLDAFSPADQRLVALSANQVAIALERTHLFEAEQTRRAELGALYDLSRALTATDSFDAILQIVAHHSVETLNTTFARLALLENDALVIRAAYPNRVLERDLEIGRRDALADLPLCQRVLKRDQPFTLDAHTEPLSPAEKSLFMLDLARSLCLVPLRTGDRALGLLMLGEARHRERESFTADKIRLAQHLGDQAASALHRAKLHEQTENRLKQVQALHTIDMTISASLDLTVTMNVLLTQVTAQLRADAAHILLRNPHTQTLEHFAGHGFRIKGAEHTSYRLGQGLAGRVALERRVISIPNLRQANLAVGSPNWRAEFVSYHGIPLIAKGQVKGVLEIFHRTAFTPDSDWLDLLETLGAQAAIAIDNTELFNGLQNSNLELALAYDATIDGWARTLDRRSQEAEGHTRRVVEWTLRLANQLGVPEADLVHIRRGALLHDLGKVVVPDTILLKPATLTPPEWEIIRQHPVYAHDLLAPIAYLRPALDIPYSHHERWDGSGYPRALRREQIPLAARIFAVIDTWDALCSAKPYRTAWSSEQALTFLREHSGVLYDPRVVEMFLQIAVTADV